MADAAFIVQNNVHGLLWVVGHFGEVKVAGTDETVFVLQVGFHPAQQTAPVVAPEQDEGKLWDAFRLHERADFEKFIAAEIDKWGPVVNKAGMKAE